MSLFAISDLHLSSDNKKSMEVFGDKWADYMKRIKDNWTSSIAEDDTVIIPGDLSWATYIEEGADDFSFLNNLPGKKIILKGNHDYWWTTLSKLNKFIKDNNFSNIHFLNNSSFLYKDTLICGTRGWICPDAEGFSQEDKKILDREIQRLKLSLQSGKEKEYKSVVAAIHYSPFGKDKEVYPEIEKLFIEFGVTICIYGHLHGPSQKDTFEGYKNGIQYKFVSADYLEFMPARLI